MAFFDDLTKKISDVTATAAQKTKDMTEVSRLNSAVSEEESKMNSAYVQIGRLYCANHAEDYEDCFEIFVKAAKESERRVAELKQHIRDIKGINPCSRCGANIPANSAFCSNCGNPAPKPEPVPVVADPNVVICPACSAKVPNTMKFCTSCGFRLPEIQQAPQAVVEQSVEPVIENSVPSDIDVMAASEIVMEASVVPDNVSLDDTYSPDEQPVQEAVQKYCNVCGKVLAEGVVFCTECGAKIG